MAVFRLLVNNLPIETNCININQKLVIGKNEEKTTQQAWQVANDRRTKLQLAKITDFGKCRFAKWLPPALFRRQKAQNLKKAC